MLFARAISNGVKWFCPDVFEMPVYTPEELGSTIVTEDTTAEVVTDHTAALQKSHTLPDLAAVWSQIPVADRPKYEAIKNARKAELSGEPVDDKIPTHARD